MPAEKVKVSIVIVAYNVQELMEKCLDEAIQAVKGIPSEIIVVDNGSKDETYALVKRKYPDVILMRLKENLGFGGGNNLGIKHARGDYVVLLNSDAFIHDGCLQKAVDKLDQDSTIGMAGGRLVRPNGELQPAAMHFPTLGQQFRKFISQSPSMWSFPKESQPVDWVPAAFAIIRREVLEEVGTFDERFYLYYEEVDLCQRIRNAGYSIWYLHDVIVTHIGGVSCQKTEGEMFSETSFQLVICRMHSALLYFRKYYGIYGAYAIYLFENLWHGLRLLKNRIFSGPDAASKIEESQVSLKLMQRAWRETKGGLQMPPKVV